MLQILLRFRLRPPGGTAELVCIWLVVMTKWGSTAAGDSDAIVHLLLANTSVASRPASDILRMQMTANVSK